MLQAAIGRVNARAGEERRKIPERDEKILMRVHGLIVEVTLRPLSACSTTGRPYQSDQPRGRPQSNIRRSRSQSPKVVYKATADDLNPRPRYGLSRLAL